MHDATCAELRMRIRPIRTRITNKSESSC